MATNLEKNLRRLTLIVGTAISLVFFQNCNKATDTKANVEVPSNSTSSADLQVSANPAEIFTNQVAVIKIEGGAGPFETSIVQGSAQLVSGTVVPTAAGNIVIEVRDILGRVKQVLLIVKNIGSGGQPNPVPPVATPKPIPTPGPTPAPTPVPTPMPTPGQSASFNLMANNACVNGYCTCHNLNGLTGQNYANAICVSKGYKSASGFGAVTGPVGLSQCTKADGSSCFQTTSPFQLICQTVSCIK